MRPLIVSHAVPLWAVTSEPGAPLVFELSKSFTGRFDFFIGLSIAESERSGSNHTAVEFTKFFAQGCLIGLLTSVAICAPLALPKWGCFDVQADVRYCFELAVCDVFGWAGIWPFEMHLLYDVFIDGFCEAEGLAEPLSKDGKDTNCFCSVMRAIC